MAKNKKGTDLLPEWENFIDTKDEKAFHALYVGYHHYFHFLGAKRGFLTTSIEDAISDVFLYVWENVEKLYAVKNHHNYLVTAFLNKLANKKPTDDDQVEKPITLTPLRQFALRS